jgi:hypothetical protein
MNRLRFSRIVSIGLLTFVTLLVVAQFAFQQISVGGGWCTPYLDAPIEMGHPAYQFTSYGFPVQLVTVVKEECFSEPTTTYEFFFPGIVIDSLLLGIVLYVWYRRNRRYRELMDVNDQEK